MTMEPTRTAPGTTGTTAATPEWFKTAVFYEVLVRSFRDSNSDGTGDFAAWSRLDYLEWLGVDCLWIPPFFPSPLGRRGTTWPTTPACCRDRDHRRLPVLPRRGPPAGHPRHHRLRHEPHQRPAPVVPGVPVRPEGPYGDFYVWSDSDELYQGGPDHLRRHRAVELDVGPGASSTSGTGSSRTNRTSTLTTRPCTTRSSRRWVVLVDMGLTVSASTPCPTPTSDRARTARTSPRPTTSQLVQGRRRRVPRPGPTLRGQPVAREDVVEYFGDFDAGGDERHMAFHFPVMPRIFMCRCVTRVALPGLRDPRADPGDPRDLPVGHLPQATTTS